MKLTEKNDYTGELHSEKYIKNQKGLYINPFWRGYEIMVNFIEPYTEGREELFDEIVIAYDLNEYLETFQQLPHVGMVVFAPCAEDDCAISHVHFWPYAKRIIFLIDNTKEI